MDKLEYTAIQNQLVMLAGIVNDLDLDGFLAAINKAESIGPILDPTLFMAGSEKLRQVSNLAHAFKQVQNEVRKQLREQAD
jgi:hypothetical protein